MNQDDCPKLLELLARWQAFSEMQQRAFEFLAAEAMAAGQEFERSTEGATGVLTRLGSAEAGDVRAETFAVVQRLQAADRSRQGLEQVASVLNTLHAQHTSLLEDSREIAASINAGEAMDVWIQALAGNVCLADWRRRLVDALYGRESAPVVADDDDELF